MSPHRPYTRDLLARTAATATSLVDMLHQLGTPVCSGSRAYLRRRLAHYAIDTAHFAPTSAAARPIPRQELAAAVAAARSCAAAIRLLGLPVNGSTRRLLSRSIAAHGLSTTHFTGQAHARGSSSPTRRTAQDILRRRAPGSPRTSTRLLRRALDDCAVPHRCAACGLGDRWQGKRLVLEIDHINGDRADNRLANLRYLCPSCHSQTRTFAKRSQAATASRTAERAQ